MDTGDHLLGWE